MKSWAFKSLVRFEEMSEQEYCFFERQKFADQNLLKKIQNCKL